MRHILTLLSLLAAAAAAAPAIAQGPPTTHAPGPFARIVTIEPKPGQEAAFEAGYQRHLAWHRLAQDPWTWYGWSFVLGERLGLFMDGTFGHAAADLDHAVDPARDAADNLRNVEPTATFRTHGLYEQLPYLSGATILPDTTRFLALTTYWVLPGQQRRFEERLTALTTQQRQEQFAWFRLRLGGAAPEYLLFRPVSGLAAAAELSPFAADFLPEVARMRTELLRYRPDMSYHP